VNTQKEKACIVYISSRNRCLAHSLKSIWEMYNYKHDYPVHVHYFDDIYDAEEIRKQLRSTSDQVLNFSSVPYTTPAHVPEEKLFYNRKDLWYVRNSFPIARKGYLHMCHFTSNMYGYENTQLENYEYIMTHDDEAGFLKELPYNPVEVMDQRPELMGALSLRIPTKIHQGHRDTSVGLWDFIKKYTEEKKIIIVNKNMRALLNDPSAPINCLYMGWPDTYVIKTKMFELDSWKCWIKAVNEFGGNYRYRWGDCLVFGMYYYIHHGTPYSFSEEGNPVDEGYYNQGKYRSIQDLAPGVKNLKR